MHEGRQNRAGGPATTRATILRRFMRPRRIPLWRPAFARNRARAAHHRRLSLRHCPRAPVSPPWGAPAAAGRTYRTCRLGVWLLGERHPLHGPQRRGPPSSQAVGHILQSSALPSIRLPSLLFLGLPDHPLLVWGFLIFAGSRHCQYLSVWFILLEFILHHGVQVWKSTVSYA